MNLKEKEKFLKKANHIHDYFYDYREICYVNDITKIKIICPTHGEFYQTPHSHKRGSGCYECGKYKNRKNKLTNENFINICKKLYGDDFYYENTIYINNRTNIIVTCKKHGDFIQQASKFLYNTAKCPKCTRHIDNEKILNNLLLSYKVKHGCKYDYSKIKYIDSLTKITIICPTHGEFYQKPNSHQQHGCPKCKNKNKTTNVFISESKKLHGYKYDYCKVDYINSKQKVTIICPTHGDFQQSPNSHKRGAGCPACNQSRGEQKISQFLKENNINFLPQHRFENCFNKRKLPFDFYLPDYNICIEYQGRQHFEPVNSFGGLDNYLKTTENDKIKEYYCKSNNIKLIKISYKDASVEASLYDIKSFRY